MCGVFSRSRSLAKLLLCQLPLQDLALAAMDAVSAKGLGSGSQLGLPEQLPPLAELQDLHL